MPLELSTQIPALPRPHKLSLFTKSNQLISQQTTPTHLSAAPPQLAWGPGPTLFPMPLSEPCIPAWENEGPLPWGFLGDRRSGTPDECFLGHPCMLACANIPSSSVTQLQCHFLWRLFQITSQKSLLSSLRSRPRPHLLPPVHPSCLCMCLPNRTANLVRIGYDVWFI